MMPSAHQRPSKNSKIVIVGLGRVAITHLEVLSQMTEMDVVAGVDIVPMEPPLYRGRPLPIYSHIGEVFAHHDADLVVIATSTSSHATVCHEVLDLRPDIAVLIEKPLASTSRQVNGLFERIAVDGSNVFVMYHMAFAPEVLWSLEVLDGGRYPIGDSILGSRSWYCDSYALDRARAEDSLESSWLDSGSNALSVLSRFVRLERTVDQQQLDAHFSTFVTEIEFETSTGLHTGEIFTTWHGAGSSQRTILEFSGGFELIMDHTSVTGAVCLNGKIQEVFGGDGTTPRRDSHYRNFYRAWATRGTLGIDVVDSLRLHQLLFTRS